MNETDAGENLRQVLKTALNEKDAAENIFAKDNGADNATIINNGGSVVVQLEFYKDADGSLR